MAGRWLPTVGRGAGAAWRAGGCVGIGVGSGGGTVGRAVGGTGVGGSGVGGTGVGGIGVGGGRVAVTTRIAAVGAGTVACTVGVSSSPLMPRTTGGRSGARTTGSRTVDGRMGAGRAPTDGRGGR